MPTRELLLGFVLSESRRGLAEHYRVLSRLLCPTSGTLVATIDKMDCQPKPGIITPVHSLHFYKLQEYILMSTSGRFSVDGYRT